MSLTSADVHHIRTGPYTDGYYSHLYGVTRSAIRHARTGSTWPHHPTLPDRRPRMPGRRFGLAVLLPVPAPSVNFGRLIAALPAPTHFNGSGGQS